MRPSGEIMAATRCRVERKWMGNEFDEESAARVLVCVSYSFVSMTAEGPDSRRRKTGALDRTIRTGGESVWSVERGPG
jgi:hypothetical protein